MIPYELVHNPSLFNSTHLGRSMANTTTNFNRSTSAKTSINGMSLSSAGARVATNIPPTNHWLSSYKNISNEVASKSRIPSRRPTWSINR